MILEPLMEIKEEKMHISIIAKITGLKKEEIEKS